MTGAKPRTAFEKIRGLHEVHRFDDGASLLFIGRIMLHERTGSIALTNMLDENRRVLHPDAVFGTIDHIVDTAPGRPAGARMPGGEVFIEAMRDAMHRHGLRLFDTGDQRQGIVHVIAPEQGIALPGITMVCPDSHTCTLGGLGALAWGIGSTDCEHALATGTLRVPPQKQMRVIIDGERPEWLTAKDIIIYLIARYSASGGKGYVIEFDGPVIRDMEIEERLTLCNMAVEFGAFSALISADEKTFDYVRGRPFAPAPEHIAEAEAHWRSLASDPGATFDKEICIDVTDLAPAVSWGTSPEHSVPVDQPIPAPAEADEVKRRSHARALEYMGLKPGETLVGKRIDGAFIGSCTNSRLSDLRRAAHILKGRHVAQHVRAICVPGSTAVKAAAEAEGLDRIFKDAGFEWQAAPCASTPAARHSSPEPA
jgi:3-isopropylmalate/(R)-2-methylmalate dehydratase large subunit